MYSTSVPRGERRMYSTEYQNLNNATPRLSPRKIFYLLLILGLGIWMLVIIRDNRRQNEKAKFMAGMKSFHDHHSHLSHKEEVPKVHKDSQKADVVVEAERKPLIIPNPNDPSKPIVITKEWTEVPKDMSLPAGLDYRVNFETGMHEVRLHPSTVNDHGISSDGNTNVPALRENDKFLSEGGPNVDSSAPSHLVSSGGMAPKLVRQIDSQKTVIEGRLDDIISKDSGKQQSSLEWLDIEAHNLPIGSAIAKARNFGNLLTLLEDPSSELRLLAASITAACVHNNAPAASFILTSSTPLIPKIIERLNLESDHQVQRRMIAILIYLAQSEVNKTLDQLLIINGFTQLDYMAHAGMDSSMLERLMVLYATLAAVEGPDTHYNSLNMLEKYIPKVTKQFEEVSLDSFKAVCHLPHTSQFPQVTAFCKKNNIVQ